MSVAPKRRLRPAQQLRRRLRAATVALFVRPRLDVSAWTIVSPMQACQPWGRFGASSPPRQRATAPIARGRLSMGSDEARDDRLGDFDLLADGGDGAAGGTSRRERRRDKPLRDAISRSRSLKERGSEERFTRSSDGSRTRSGRSGGSASSDSGGSSSKGRTAPSNRRKDRKETFAGSSRRGKSDDAADGNARTMSASFNEEDDEDEDGGGDRQDQPPPPHHHFEEFDPAVLPPEERSLWAEMRAIAGTPAAVDALKKVVAALPGGAVPPRLFQQLFSFDLDDFQLAALAALARRRSVVVSAPTGSGKTVAGELAIYYGLALGLRVFYTTPLKALSNQKFADFRAQFGASRVGLLTGDSSLNRDAQVCVMTTEVFRNMLYDGERRGAAADDELKELFAVVFDEMHFMNDRDRGTVWEESIISCPQHVLMVALSATMGNVQEVSDWIGQTHGPTDLVTSDFRPVPLRYWYANRYGLFPLFRDVNSGPGAPNGGLEPAQNTINNNNNDLLFTDNGGSSDANTNKGANAGRRGFSTKASAASQQLARKRRRRLPERLRLNEQLVEMHEEEQEQLKRAAVGSGFDGRGGGGRFDGRAGGGRSGGGGGGGGGRRFGSGRGAKDIVARQVPSFPFLIRGLRRRSLLPAIVFIFSRVGCDRAANDVGVEFLRAPEDQGRGDLAEDGEISATDVRLPGLLSAEEAAAVAERLQAFRAANPQIPVTQSRATLLLQGVATHHAGLLPVYKAFIEELFAANLVKVIFATETLAAGVNMPARTTVITSLSKRGDTGIVKLEPSQLLQMAGRAGRRGKDTQGGVVIMRSRYEDALEAHRLLLSPLNPIQSNFRSSYSMAANLLRSRGLAAARNVVERSFGNFLHARRSDPAAQQALEATERLSELENGLGGISLGEAKQYRKLWERQRGEERILSYLLEQERDVEKDVVQTVLPFSRLGAALRLRSPETTAVLLADYEVPGSDADRVVALAVDGNVFAVPYDDVRFVDASPDAGISAEAAAAIAAAVAPRAPWLPLKQPSSTSTSTSTTNAAPSTVTPVTDAITAETTINDNAAADVLLTPFLGAQNAPQSQNAQTQRLPLGLRPPPLLAPSALERAGWGQEVERKLAAAAAAAAAAASAGAAVEEAGHISRQRAVLARAKSQVEGHAVHASLAAEKSKKEGVLRLGKDIAALEDAVRQGWKSEKRAAEQPAWAEFLSVCRVLRRYNALEGDVDAEAAASSALSSSLPSPAAAADGATVGAKSAARGAATLSGGRNQAAISEEASLPLAQNGAAAAAAVAATAALAAAAATAAAGAGGLRPTAFGDLVGAINAENELWLALVLSSTAVKSLPPMALAAVMPAVLGEYSRPDQFVAYGASPAVIDCITELAPLAQGLLEAQFMENVDFAVRLDASLCGLVESWASGCDWAELVGSTTLDQGDICRLLRRCMELLRQIPVLPGIPGLLKDRARAAAELLDRFPVSDDTNYLLAAETDETDVTDVTDVTDGSEEEGVEEEMETAAAAGALGGAASGGGGGGEQ